MLMIVDIIVSILSYFKLLSQHLFGESEDKLQEKYPTFVSKVKPKNPLPGRKYTNHSIKWFRKMSQQHRGRSLKSRYLDPFYVVFLSYSGKILASCIELAATAYFKIFLSLSFINY
jgi:hypothetical protein